MVGCEMVAAETLALGAGAGGGTARGRGDAATGAEATVGVGWIGDAGAVRVGATDDDFAPA